MIETVMASEITRRLNAALQAQYRRPPDEAALGRSVQYWANQGLLRSIGGLHTGKGRERLFSREEILRAAILHQLSKFNTSAGTMQLMMEEVDREIEAVSPGSDLIELLDASSIHYFVWSTYGYPDTYGLAATVRRPSPPEALFPRISVDARAWRTHLNL
jgi:hypothetical protein